MNGHSSEFLSYWFVMSNQKRIQFFEEEKNSIKEEDHPITYSYLKSQSSIETVDKINNLLIKAVKSGQGWTLFRISPIYWGLYCSLAEEVNSVIGVKRDNLLLVLREKLEEENWQYFNEVRALVGSESIK